jgi:CubicO group peptidase (beta-lactamase class C family)
VVRDGDTGTGGAGGAGPRTIFQVGSVTKLFTALLLADMAERGEVRLSDPAARYLPGARDAADPVTLADLATHTSGFPRLPAGLFWSAWLSPRDPYARYPASWFRRAARRALRTGSGGSPYAYSNFGYGLLGYLLGRAAGSDYETLVATRVCGPLGPAIRAALAPRRPVPGGDIGLAWHHTRRGENRISWHNGMTGGFSAMVALDPDRGLGVAALANSGGRPPSPLDAAVMAALG